MGLHRASQDGMQRGTFIPLEAKDIESEVEALREDVLNWNHGHPMSLAETPDRQDAA